MMAKIVEHNNKSVCEKSNDSEMFQSLGNDSDVKDIRNEVEKMISNNPLNIFGVGILSQFNLIIHLIVVFTIFSLLSIPIILIYSDYDAMKGRPIAFASTTLGNLGFTSSNCFSVSKQIGTMVMFCNTGVFDSDIGSFGVMPSDSQDKNFCISGAGDSAKCTDRFDVEGFRQQFAHSCANQKFCTLTNLDSYFLGTSDGCNNDKSIFFLNAQCVQELDVINTKRVKVHYIVCICILISLLYLVMLYYSTKSSQISAKEWDLNTITAGDYTVCRKINQIEYDEFLKMHTNEDSPAYDYMLKLKKDYELEISNQPMVNEECTDIKIANISFAFDNHEIINLLEKRGTAITNKDNKMKNEIDTQIDQHLKIFYNEISKPTYAFITFETQEGYERAKLWKVNSQKQFEKAGEPTNIIWENLHFTRLQQINRAALVAIFVFILLIATFYLFIWIKQELSENNRKYLSLNCNSFDAQMENDDARLKYAIIDYYGYYQNSTATKMTGALQCFCNSYFNEHGFVESIDTKFSHPDVKIDGVVYSDYICEDFAYERYKIPLIATGISIIIVALNYFLREIIIKIVMKIGFQSETNQTKAIMVWIFVIQFFNTAICNLLTNANLNESLGIPIFKGSYPDFTFNWYLDFGVPLITAMIINAVFPLIEFAMWYGINKVYILLDRGFTCRIYQTKAISIQQFINLYAGPEYLIHYKYSSILNIVFVTFMYGLALPLLFPIALISLVIVYIIEKLCVVYYYKEPPSYDEKLNVTAVKILSWAPMLMYCVGYWMISNKQMFKNDAAVNLRANPLFEKTNHELFQGISSGPELSLFICACLLPIFYLVKYIVFQVKSKYNFVDNFQSSSDEHLPRYFDALGGPTLSKIVKQEIGMRRDYGYRTIMDSTLTGILNATPGYKTIVGVGFYDMLFNDKYKERFQFFHSVDSKHASMNLDCVKIQLALTAGFQKYRSCSLTSLALSSYTEGNPSLLNPSPPRLSYSISQIHPRSRAKVEFRLK